MKISLTMTLRSDIDVCKITDISTSLVFICTNPPFDVRYLILDNYVDGKYNEIDSALRIAEDQKDKHGYSIDKPWDTNVHEDFNNDPSGGFTDF